jgi:redox-sensitive bicupin YhaK (pirin superfamily)
MIAIRKSSQRGHANHGWLDTSHTFSFAGYYDPKHMGFGALRVINEDRVGPGKGFGSHGHEDMEILTYVLSGALAHTDSMGNVETLYANDLQRITAGTGIVHSEFNGSHTEPVHFLQIWMEPAVNGLQPGYQQLSLTEEQKLGKLVLVASGEGGGPLKIHQDVQVLIGQVEAGQELAHRLEAGRQAWVHVVRGAATVNGQPLATGDAAAVTGEPAVTLTGTDANTEVLVFDLA